MISSKSLTKEWILKLSSEIGKRGDPKILEKVIRAFVLLEQIQLNNIPLIFKGGTSLLLLIDPPRRFSIDIDLIVHADEISLFPVFDKIVSDGFFTSWKPDNDRKQSINAPVGHYKFYYQSIVGSHFGEEPVLLDVLFSENYYSEVIATDLAHKWLLNEKPNTIIRIPSVESVLGDKLTAFAPSTTGILYTKNRPVEIIKQLFDVAALFDKITDLNHVKNSYFNIVKKEVEYRKLNISLTDALEDTFQAALAISLRDTNSDNFKHLQLGVSNIVNFIIERFTIEEAIICAAKAAYLSGLLRQVNPLAIARYANAAQIKDMEITNTLYNKLIRLKKTNPEAFFYWYQAIELRDTII